MTFGLVHASYSLPEWQTDLLCTLKSEDNFMGPVNAPPPSVFSNIAFKMTAAINVPLRFL